MQGIGGAAMFAVSLALVAQEFAAGRERATAMGIYGATIGVSVAIGPLVGGAITSGLGWRWVFFLNVPIGIRRDRADLHAKIRESRDPNATRIDWLGLVSFSSALVMLVLALLRGNDDGWGSPLIVGLFAGAAAMLAAFAAIEQRVAEPMLPLELFRRARVHRRPARGGRGVGLAVRAVPVPDPVPAELPRLLAAPGRASLPADHAGPVPGRAARRRADGRGSARAS